LRPWILPAPVFRQSRLTNHDSLIPLESTLVEVHQNKRLYLRIIHFTKEV
jgi:hypothetical protein